ncbi:MAG: ABC transporter permease [Bacteroidales bacterium]|nr:ABC transporter permease [Bacteroidales bacterium]
MFDLDSWQEVWFTITKNKMRSLMTAFGVFWGIFMLVVMLGAGTALENGIFNGVKGFASNSYFMFSGRTTVPYKGFRKGRVWELKIDDIEILKRKIDGIKYITPMVFGQGGSNNIVRKDKYGSFSTLGTGSNYILINPMTFLYGRYINDLDVLEKRKVCTIGSKVYNDLFNKGEDPEGALIKISGIYYTVVGVVEPLSDNFNFGGPAEEMIYIPYTLAQQTNQMGNEIHSIGITLDDNLPMSENEERIKSIVKANHQIAPDDVQAVNGFNVQKLFQTFMSLTLGIKILIWIVGLGTLLAGVVGVSNIMLVTIKERTQEIGIRRALGAKPSQIIVQIMSESLVLTSIAGIVGICCGVGLLSLVSSLLEANPTENTFFLNPQISFVVAIVSLFVLIICGMIAGLLPSYRAMQIKAIDALRDE